MNARYLLLGILAAAPASHAQLFDSAQRGAYLSGEIGNGHIEGPGATGDTSMRWRALEVRAGRDLNPAIVGEDSLDGKSTARIDFVYYNEGHPDNNHRDGFAFQFTYTRRFGDALTAELSVGPYTSMNTTTVNGEQIDQARGGILYSAALRYPLDRWVRGAHFRLGYNHAWTHGTFHSDAILFGIGHHFTDVPPFPDTSMMRSRLWLGGSYGRSITNLSGTQGANGFTLQARKYGGKWAASLAAVDEGDDGTRVDRRGVAAQFWFVQPFTERWAASAGIGPYYAINRREDNRKDVNGLITLQFEDSLSERTKAFFAFSRVKTFRESNDRDLYHLGLLRRF